MKTKLIMGILAIFASLFSCNAQQVKYQSVGVQESCEIRFYWKNITL